MKTDEYGVQYSDDGKTLIKCPEDLQGEYVIPEGVIRVESNAFADCRDLISIKLPKSLQSIGVRGFKDCPLKQIHIPANVTSIEQFAFRGCGKTMESITVDPDNKVYDSRENCNAIIETKTNAIIQGCNNSKIPDNIEVIRFAAFENCEQLKDIHLPQCLTKIERCAFEYCNGLTSVTIPGSVSTIEYAAFSQCQHLVSVEIQEGVSTLESNAFSSCVELQRVVLPNSLRSIGNEAFRSCYLLEDITIPAGVVSIGNETFALCSHIISFDIPQSVTQIGEKAFEGIINISYPGNAQGAPWGARLMNVYTEGDLIYKDATKTKLESCNPHVTEVIVPETVKSVNPDAFMGCAELTSVSIGLGYKSIKSISDKLFRNCPKLSHVVLGESITKLGVGAFNRGGGKMYENGLAKNLQSITLPASLKEVGWHGFYGVSTLKEVHISDLAAFCNVNFAEDGNPLNHAHHLFLGDEEIHDLVIPEAVTRIPKRLFFGCEGFTSVTIPNTVTEIGAEAFKGCTGLKTVIIPESVTKIGRDAFDGTVHIIYRGSAQWEEDNLWWGARCLNGYVDGDLIYDSEKRTILYGCLKSDIGDVVLPDSVNKIGGRAFQRCSGLTSIMLPESVKEIGAKAFEGCSSLKFITIPEGVLEIGRATFKGCTNLSSVTIPDSATCWDFEIFHNCENLQKVRIPEGVEGIDNFAFGGCARLTEITIPKSVKYFNSWAFHSCAGLETIIFQGQVELCYWCLYGCNNLKHIIIPKGTKEHFLQQDKNTDLGIKNFAEILEEEGTHVAEQQQEVMTLLTMAQGFDKGIGVPQNGEMAISLYKQAAEKGSPEAAYRLGVCYRDGEYVQQDKEAALTYFRQAAESKYKDSEEQIAKLQ